MSNQFLTNEDCEKILCLAVGEDRLASKLDRIFWKQGNLEAMQVISKEKMSIWKARVELTNLWRQIDGGS